jgi:hypothetical protein
MFDTELACGQTGIPSAHHVFVVSLASAPTGQACLAVVYLADLSTASLCL